MNQYRFKGKVLKGLMHYTSNIARHSCYLIFLLVYIGACGKSDHRLTADDEAKGALVVLSGGFGSCERRGSVDNDPRSITMQPLLQTVLTKTKEKGLGPIHTVVACFSRSLRAASETIHYVLSSDPSRVESTSRSLFYTAVNELAIREKVKATFIIGHSYGGWNAMQMSLALDPNQKLATLITIDPISPSTCTPANILASNIPGQVGNSGCQSAPTDLSEATKIKIATRAKHWSNFYQTDFRLLHSSPMREANNNLRLDHARTPLRAHSAIQSHPAIWQFVESQLTAALESSGGDGDDSDDDLFLAFAKGSDVDGEERLLVSSRSDIDIRRIEMCLGETCTDASTLDLDFELVGAQPFSTRRLFKGKASLKLNEGLVYTLIAAAGNGQVVSKRSFRFARK